MCIYTKRCNKTREWSDADTGTNLIGIRLSPAQRRWSTDQTVVWSTGQQLDLLTMMLNADYGDDDAVKQVKLCM